jgi:hypothetical protein
MGNKTVYVSDEAEKIWDEARRLRGDDASVSQLLTELLQDFVLTSSNAAPAFDWENEIADAEDRRTHRELVNKIKSLFRQYSYRTTSEAFGIALVEHGAAHSRAKVKADATMGPAGRNAAAQKAVATKGTDGMRRAGIRAAAMRSVKAKRG